MKSCLGFLCCFILIAYSQQECTSCPCEECPSGSTCREQWMGVLDQPWIYCDEICMSCARYIFYPCSNCPTGTFCYIIWGNGIPITCLGCDSYPNFCAAPYTYGSYPKEELVPIASDSSAFQKLPFLKNP